MGLGTTLFGKGDPEDHGSTDEREWECGEIPSSHREYMDHAFLPEKVHFTYGHNRHIRDRSKIDIYEKYWHECQTCGEACGHHRDVIGTIEISDDGLRIVDGAVDE